MAGGWRRRVGYRGWGGEGRGLEIRERRLDCCATEGATVGGRVGATREVRASSEMRVDKDKVFARAATFP